MDSRQFILYLEMSTNEQPRKIFIDEVNEIICPEQNENWDKEHHISLPFSRKCFLEKDTYIHTKSRKVVEVVRRYCKSYRLDVRYFVDGEPILEEDVDTIASCFEYSQDIPSVSIYLAHVKQLTGKDFDITEFELDSVSIKHCVKFNIKYAVKFKYCRLNFIVYLVELNMHNTIWVGIQGPHSKDNEYITVKELDFIALAQALANIAIVFNKRKYKMIMSTPIKYDGKEQENLIKVFFPKVYNKITDLEKSKVTEGVNYMIQSKHAQEKLNGK